MSFRKASDAQNVKDGRMRIYLIALSIADAVKNIFTAKAPREKNMETMEKQNQKEVLERLKSKSDEYRRAFYHYDNLVLNSKFSWDQVFVYSSLNEGMTIDQLEEELWGVCSKLSKGN